MPSPFPGMDPYLEGEMWQEFHQTLANELRAQLMPRLRPKYVALLAKRYVLQSSELGIASQDSSRVFYPDVHVAEIERAYKLHETSGGTLLSEPMVELISPTLEEIPILSVEIRDVAQRRLVTLIEILSRVNKVEDGAREYNLRRLELLQTPTHLLEIDLLRRGQRIKLEGVLPSAHYYAFLSRANRRPKTEVWPIDLKQALPTIPVPLLRPDPDVPLDLQAALRACFELVGYEHLLDYSQQPPPPPLTETENLWVSEQLRRKE
jgi:hypothetical protein